MLRIAFALQNVGGVQFEQDLGDTVPVKQSIIGLRGRGHKVTCVRLDGRRVIRMDNSLGPDESHLVSSGYIDSAPFHLIESGIRRLQQEINLPYFAFFDSLRFYKACVRLLPGFDLCHEYHGLFSIGASLASRNIGIPYVLSLPSDQFVEKEIRGAPLRGIHSSIAQQELSYCLAAADRIVLVSDAAKRHFVESWQVEEEKIAVLPNGVDVNLFSSATIPHRAMDGFRLGDSHVIMFVGTFREWHGLEILIKAFQRLTIRSPDVRLVLVGDGPARQSIEKLIRQLNLERTVHITGFVPQTEVVSFLSLADIAVLPYPNLPNELWFSPLKLYEYMAAGKAIVASRAGQIKQVIRDGVTGILVEPGDIRDLEEALSTLIRSPARRSELGSAAKELARKKHSWEGYVRRLEGIYEDAFRAHERRSFNHGDPD